MTLSNVIVGRLEILDIAVACEDNSNKKWQMASSIQYILCN